MKNKLAAVLLAATACVQLSAMSFAENGPWTTNHPFAWGVTSFPFRVVTGSVGLGMGALTGSVKGIVDTEQKFAKHTFDGASKNPALIPVGLVGAAVAVPVGIITGAPQGAFDSGKVGYDWWNRF